MAGVADFRQFADWACQYGDIWQLQHRMELFPGKRLARRPVCHFNSCLVGGKLQSFAKAFDILRLE